MPKILSHGAWTRGADAVLPGGARYQTFAHTDGRDWYAYAHERLVDDATLKVLVRDGVVMMVERDGTRIVPPGDVFEVPDTLSVERGWLWRGDRFAPAPDPVPEDATSKLAAFLRANPDVRALIGGDAP